MNQHDQRDRELSPTDRRWVEALGEAFRPEPLDRARANAFDRRLEERILHRRLRIRIAVPAFAFGAGALALWLSFGTPAPTPAPASLAAFTDPAEATADLMEPQAYLPDDYRMLALLIEDASDER
jgi:hypothetical protein